MNKKLWIGSGLVVVVAVLAIVNLKRSNGHALEVQVTKVKRGDITQVVSGSGRIEPETEVKISANVSAEIKKIHVDEGDTVRQGQILVELARDRYEAAINQAESNLKAAKANLAKAVSQLRRTEDLYKKGLSSEVELESARAAKIQAESAVAQAEAALEQAKDDLARTILKAPIDGVVTKINKEEGEIALGSMFQADVIMTVADLSRMQMVAEIDENDVVLVHIGDTARVDIDAIPDTTFLGTVSEIAHTATTRGFGTQEQVTNFEVKISLFGHPQKVLPGMSASVDIETETHRGVLYVPIQSVTARSKSELEEAERRLRQRRRPKQRRGKERPTEYTNGESENLASARDSDLGRKKEEMVEVVFVVEDGRVRAARVKTGISSDTDIEIVDGLREGEEVVTGPYRTLSRLLKPGSRVKVKKAKRPRDVEGDTE